MSFLVVLFPTNYLSLNKLYGVQYCHGFVVCLGGVADLLLVVVCTCGLVGAWGTVVIILS